MTDFEKLIDAAKRGDLALAKKVLENHPEFISKKDQTGATALHYSAFGGHQEIVRLLVKRDADINARDDRFDATPTGWAIEYLRELGGFLSIELQDFAYAIEHRDVDWVRRFLQRFPALAKMNAPDGRAFRSMAVQSGGSEIVELFGPADRIE